MAIHADGDGSPGSRLRTLVNPTGLDDNTATAEEFTTTLVLQANTTYWVVVTRASGSGAVGLGTTVSAAEDAGTAAGWTITSTAWQRSGGAWAAATGSSALKLATMGGENPYVLGWAVSSAPMSGDTYGAGENLELEVTFNGPVVTGNLLRAHLWVGTPRLHRQLSQLPLRLGQRHQETGVFLQGSGEGCGRQRIQRGCWFPEAGRPGDRPFRRNAGQPVRGCR